MVIIKMDWKHMYFVILFSSWLSWQSDCVIFLQGTVSGSGTGPLDYGATSPVPDTEPRLWGLSRGPVVCETTTRHV